MSGRLKFGHVFSVSERQMCFLAPFVVPLLDFDCVKEAFPQFSVLVFVIGKLNFRKAARFAYNGVFAVIHKTLISYGVMYYKRH